MRLIVTEFCEVEEYHVEYVHKIECKCWKFINPHCILINNSVKINYDDDYYMSIGIEEEYNITYNRQPGEYLKRQLEINERKQKEKKTKRRRYTKRKTNKNKNRMVKNI